MVENTLALAGNLAKRAHLLSDLELVHLQYQMIYMVPNIKYKHFDIYY